MADIFYWTGDDNSSVEPDWMTAGLRAGTVRVEKGGTPEVYLVIHGKRFPRFSVITRRDLEHPPQSRR
jgi:hypothetical protein